MVLLSSSPKNKNDQNNPYHDKLDPDTGYYHYMGQGRKGDQQLDKKNYKLYESTQKKTDTHLFVQSRLSKEYRYEGKVVLKDTKEEFSDATGKKRRVFVFILCCVD